MADEPPRLRRLRATDAADVLAAFGTHDDEDMARQGSVASLADAEAYVSRLIATDSPHEPWALTERDRLLGLVCVSVDEENRSGWFWYWTAAEARGRGWTSRAAATVARWALTVRGLERLELGHRVNNPASGAVARRAGFVKEGTERGKFVMNGERVDVDTYGRLRSDPSPDVVPLVMEDVPHLVLMCGLAGAGKSTYARTMQASGYERFSIDEELWHLGWRDTGPAPDEVEDDLRARQREQVAAALTAGHDVVVDHAFWSRAHRNEYRELGRRHGARVEVVYLTAPIAVLRDRLAARAGAHADDVVVDEDTWERYVAGFQAPGPDETDVTVVES